MHLEEQVTLAPYTTLKIGGPARFFVSVLSEDDLREAVRFARERGLPVFVLGGGSNLVVKDEGYAGVVLHVQLPPSIVRSQSGSAILVDVSAGTDWDELVLELCERGISGMECLAGIPGLVGGSPIQNIGAYGQEVAQTIEWVRALDLETGEFVTLSAAACGFSYRSSVFNTVARGRFVVTSVRFRLSADARPNLTYADLAKHFAGRPSPTPMEVYRAVREIRAGKGMLIDSANASADSRSAGSFFKNPIVAADMLAKVAGAAGMAEEAVPHWPAGEGRIKLPAAWLIERAGFAKGFAMGEVGISSRHTLALINLTGKATYAHLMELRDRIGAVVQERFGIGLEQEPVVLGGMDPSPRLP